MARFNGVKVTWYGHSAFKLESPHGKVILIDPWISNPEAPKNAREMLDRVDLILITHGHGDHIGDAVSLAKEFDATCVGIYEIANYLSSKGVKNTLGMNIGGNYNFGDIKISMVEASHSSTAYEGNTPVPLGNPVGFVITFKNGFKVYHMGDTGLFGGLSVIGEFYRPDLILIPIGDLFTLGPEEAAYAVKLIRPEYIIPMHYKTFPLLKGTPEKFLELLGKEYKDKVIVLKPGETAE